MNHFLVLVDFTPTADISVSQAIELAKAKNAKLTVAHIYKTKPDEHTDSLKAELNPYKSRIQAENITCDVRIEHGDLFSASELLVNELQPDLVIVGTHGKQGIRQNLFGSSIHKMVRSLKAPTLVVNDNTDVKSGGFKNILVPVAPHMEFQKKIEQTIVVIDNGGKLTLFAIKKNGIELEEDIKENIVSSLRYLDENEISWEFKEIEEFSSNIGYSDDTLKYGKENNMDLVSIIADVSKQNAHFGKMDKENMLLNEKGLPVLCANW